MATTSRSKRTVRNAIAAGLISVGAVALPAAPAMAAPVTIPGIGTFDVPDHLAIPTNFDVPVFELPQVPNLPQINTGSADPQFIAAPFSRGNQVADIALSKVGSPYVWGATGPNAFDCSGLVQWAHGQAGISVPRTSQAQVGSGTPVAYNNLQRGDVVAFYSGASHVGIYIGNGQVVHALNSSQPVRVDSIGMMPFHSARRYA
ncbi:C40 family peptidase [Hoyosella rhizosphaerae]|uniref:Endopeptidase Cgl2188 n=1 Tax=Hoyosella rhizosphaerae TaxID=1755582 RepID=A0A916UGP0_9ACTN|nr:C40 family peptidase [Hoyosella rhizosphaerae]MBN4927948.1 C40 family peptidase [Hoyosella rhizosphaerae]GGC71211.1 putative endopeptidase Cgl2188 [Hoyosella rhizosphaerae]